MQLKKIYGTLNGVNPGVLAAAGDYADKDVLSDNASNGAGHYWVFTGVTGKKGQGLIKKALLNTSVAAWAAALKLWLFHTAPTTTELDDNSAFSLTAADRASCLGYIDFATAFNAGGISWQQNLTVEMEVWTPGSDGSLYGVLETAAAETGEAASMTVMIELEVEQYSVER